MAFNEIGVANFITFLALIFIKLIKTATTSVLQQ